MGVRYPGRASIDPSAPQAIGVCDRCGQLYNLSDLRYQPVWAGPNVLVTTLRVCTITCWDVPNEQLRTIRIPPDPWPVSDPRVENFAVDEVNHLDLKAWIGKPSMFLAASSVECELTATLGFTFDYTGVSSLNAELEHALRFSAPFEGVSSFDAELKRAVDLLAPFEGVSSFDAELELTPPAAPQVEISFEDSYVFVANNTYTEVGAAIGAAAADRLVFVALSGIATSATMATCTIGGVSATKGPTVNRASLGINSVSEIWWALVPTGTTADIVLTFTSTSGIGVSVYRVVNADTTTPIVSSSTGNVASGPVSASISPIALSAVIATSAVGVNTGDPTVTWTNATEDVEQAAPLGGGEVQSASSASDEHATAPGSISISVDASAAGTSPVKTLAIVNIQPA